MTYFEGFIAPVPEANRGKYEDHSRSFAPIVQDVGVERMVESWESDVSDGKLTDFRKAVQATPEEKIVFSFFEYPSRVERDAANQRMMTDPRMQDMSDMPFDGKRMVMGGFDAIVDEGKAGGDYVDGWVVPVPTDKREAYCQVASKMAPRFRELGATRIVEAFGDDVARGEVTDFYRAVKAEDDESVVFSFIEWPDKATRDAGWAKIMSDESMRPEGEMPFDGKRMFWGGFDKILDTRA
jgi:uncharacterized protein YbaA (DUF1428 family)